MLVETEIDTTTIEIGIEIVMLIGRERGEKEGREIETEVDLYLILPVVLKMMTGIPIILIVIEAARG